ncbi:hypothetical protein CD116_01740 [Staphylococcus schweitzeri]|uniref:Uncharacterized protein n=1 Tax=Staphylococcus schweitzeri TaxID=1654388 RepID=A0A2K4ALV4_9STAP|nr:hypothetical protein CD116_01740 [Staphylococcus schweitzeri]
MLGPLTRIEKSLLQAHFRSVNYCQYNFVEHRTLIYVSGSSPILKSHQNSQLHDRFDGFLIIYRFVIRFLKVNKIS